MKQNLRNVRKVSDLFIFTEVQYWNEPRWRSEVLKPTFIDS